MGRWTETDVRSVLRSHWGLYLDRCDPTARGRRVSEWRSGWMVSGDIPGYGHGYRRYRSLAEIVRMFDLPTPGKGGAR